MMCDFDHHDGNPKNNTFENCSPISTLAHRIKTKSNKDYNDLMSDKNKIKIFRTDTICELIDGMKIDQMLDNDTKMRIIERLNAVAIYT